MNQVRIKGQMKAKEGMEIVDEMERRLAMLYPPSFLLSLQLLESP